MKQLSKCLTQGSWRQKGYSPSEPEEYECTHRHVLVEVHRIIVYVIGDEVVIGNGKESHFWDGEHIHKLLHFRALERERSKCAMSRKELQIRHSM